MLAGFGLHCATNPDDAMKIHFCDNPACSRPYQINDYDLSDRQDLVSGVIACPHCGAETPGDTAMVFRTHALARDEELRLIANRPRS